MKRATDSMARSIKTAGHPTPFAKAHLRRTIGFTLIELLVAVSVMVVMILGFSAVLSQAQKVVTASQGIIAANSSAAVVAQLIRKDFASITKDGFLAIVAPVPADAALLDATTPPAVLFTTTGVFPARSQMHPDTKANAAVVCYTIRQDTSRDNIPDVLCREAHLLTWNVGPPFEDWNGTDDVMNRYLQTVNAYTRSEISDDEILNHMVDGFDATATTPQDMSEIRNAWPILVIGCEEFSVQWLDTNNKWRGFSYVDGVVKVNAEIDDGTEDDWDTQGVDEIESKRTTGAYMAMWTHHDRNNWPRAVRVRFKLEGNKNEYEVICNIDR